MLMMDPLVLMLYYLEGICQHQVYIGDVAGYNSTRGLYHIECKDGDTEDYYHHVVYDQQKRWLPVFEEQKKQKKVKRYHICSKYTPCELDYEEHVISLKVGIICIIACIHHTLVVS